MDREHQIRAWLAVTVLALLIGVLIGAAFGASHDKPKPAAIPVAPPAPPPPIAPEPARAAPAVLRRSGLLEVVMRAAANYAAGLPYSGEQKQLAGRRFELVAPIGCEGPTPTLTLDPAQVAVDAKAQTITFLAQPRDWTQTGWVKDVIGPAPIEAAEGYWLPRPWQSNEDCPLQREPTAGEPPPTLAPPSVGVVQISGPEDSRLVPRKDRPFKFVKKATAEEIQSLDVAGKFVVSGRLKAFPSGEVVRCRSSSTDQWPICLIGVQIDRTAFLNRTGDVLAEWSVPALSPEGAGVPSITTSRAERSARATP